MRRFLIQIIGIFFVGMAGGIFGSQAVWPLLVERPLFYQYRLQQNPTYITETKQITVQENIALQDAADQVRKTVVAVQGGKLRGSGLILTSDGIIVTLNELLPAGGEFAFFVDGESVKYQVLKRDSALNLALVKLDKGGLSTVSFADRGRLRLGQRVFLVGSRVGPADEAGKRPQSFIVNEGVVRAFDDDAVETTIFESSMVRGAPLFDIAGSVVGLSDVDQTGRVVGISTAAIKKFAGF